MFPGPPIALTGAAITLLPPVDAGQLGSVLLVNNSGYLLQIDGLDVPRTLQPWTADVFALGAGRLTVTTVASVSPPPAGVSAYLLPTWALAGEQLPGSYPLTLTANAVAALTSAAPAAQTLNVNAVASGVNLVASLAAPAAGHYYLLRRLSVQGPASTVCLLTVGGVFVNGTANGALDENEMVVPVTVPSGQVPTLTWSSSTGADIHLLTALARWEWDDRTS